MLVWFLNLNKWIIPVFWAIKVMYFDLTKKNVAALNNERLAKIWNPGNVKLQTRKCRLRFPMNNLMLKVFNHSQTHMLGVFDPTKCWKNYSIPSRQASWANNLKKQIRRQGRNSKKWLFAHLQGRHQYISRRMQQHICPIKIVPSDPQWTRS